MNTPGTVAMADQALLRLPPPPVPDVLSCVKALIEYTSAVVPGFTSAPAARDVTEPMTLSFVGCVMLTLTVWSACTVTPLVDAASRVDDSAAVIVYVSGLSEMNEKRPDASVVVVADCEALTAVTRAPLTGWFDDGSTTEPLMTPVVPARTLVVPWSTNAMSNRTATIPRLTE